MFNKLGACQFFLPTIPIMKKRFVYIISAMLFVYSISVKAQVPVKVENGTIFINDGSFKPDPNKYTLIADSLDKRLKLNDKDTTSLFFRALLYLSFNDLKAKPYQGEKGALENLTAGKNLAEKAIDLNMQDFKLKVLRAQIYKELCYRYSGDESWKFDNKQIAERRIQFNTYKELANKYYDELAFLDKPNTYDYEKLKVKAKYPL